MSVEHDHEGKKLGMWLFLYTELILFGGLFVLYAVYFSTFPKEFVDGGKELNRFFGSINTIILLLSSFTVAASITAIQKKEDKKALLFLGISILSGLIFLINKYVEWGHKFEVGIFPNSQILNDGPPGVNIFFGLYYVITGLHGIHIIIGMTLLIISLVLIIKQKIHSTSYTFLENSGLYWHLVDLIWIFIFPLFYLVL